MVRHISDPLLIAFTESRHFPCLPTSRLPIYGEAVVSLRIKNAGLLLNVC